MIEATPYSLQFTFARIGVYMNSYLNNAFRCDEMRAEVIYAHSDIHEC